MAKSLNLKGLKAFFFSAAPHQNGKQECLYFWGEEYRMNGEQRRY
ncbi:hypothetical protein EFW58_03386 [Bacillus velezensis]|nr:hypothetical protein EFW58_03386 [Bacillus velezensis]